MEIFIVIFILIVIMAIVYGISVAVTQSNQKKAMDEKLGSLQDFTATQKLMGGDGSTGIAVDENEKKVCLIKYQSADVALRVFSYKDILAAEVLEDGSTVTKTSRGSQIGGALLGGITFGPVGAFIGGLSGQKITYGKIRRVDLRIIVNDTKEPTHVINLQDTECEKSSAIYKLFRQRADHWYALITVLIKQADEEDSSLESKAISPNQSVADELLKLSTLLDKGVITQEEFESQKVKLLA